MEVQKKGLLELRDCEEHVTALAKVIGHQVYE